MVDLGGGSCELTISSQGHIRYGEFASGRGAPDQTSSCSMIRPAKLNCGGCEGFVEREIGRIADRIARIPPQSGDCDFRHRGLSCRSVSRPLQTKAARATLSPGAQMRHIAKMLSLRPLDNASNSLGSGRGGQIVIAGAVVLCRTSGTVPVGGVPRYSPLGLRDGLLAQMAAEYDRSARSVKHIQSERWDSIRAAVAHYRVDMDHALQVREAAMHLFKALKSVHRLPPEYSEWLSAAAMLYEVGDYVNRNGRHRHAYYIVAHSEILGYTPEQRRIIAATARYLGKSHPVPGDAAMKVLPPVDRDCVRKASLLLRLARALNLGRSAAVRGTRVQVSDGGVNLVLLARPRASVDLELWAVEKERSYFLEVFGRELPAAAA